MSDSHADRILQPRSGGVLLHVTSLPGSGPIGDLGPMAYRWLDWLQRAGCGAWQLLPLGPPGLGHSPYQSQSSFAGNPLLISPELLVEDGLLPPRAVPTANNDPPDRVDFAAAAGQRSELLAQAFEAFRAEVEHPLAEAFARFKGENQNWLEDYVQFRVIKQEQQGAAWPQWPAPLRQREDSALRRVSESWPDKLEQERFIQFLFDRQWSALRQRSAAANVGLIGDIPIFVALDSADVWANQELFQLDDDGQPEVVAGVPPDYFSATGQRWGNPHYRWPRMAERGYSWWKARIRRARQRVDLLRLDHFRGFEAYWEIPAEAETAQSGRWVSGPGAELFEALHDELGRLPLIAEDLGVITPEVRQLRTRFNLPGMKVLQFAFSGDPANPYLPHTYERNFVVYTGTHDNNTTLGWYQDAPEAERDLCRRYLGVDGQDIAWDMIRAAWSSVADLAVVPLQDMLSLGSEARMNVPGEAQGQWRWRARQDSLSDGLAARMRELNQLYGRDAS